MAGGAVGADPPDLGALVADRRRRGRGTGRPRSCSRACRPRGRSRRPSSGRAGRTGDGSCRSRRGARPREPGRRQRACSSRQPTRVRRVADRLDRRQAGPDGHPGAAASTRTFDRPRAGPAGSVSSASGQCSPASSRRRPRAERQERDEVADCRPHEITRRGARISRHPRPRVEQLDRPVGQLGARCQEPDVREQVVGPRPPNAPTIVSASAPRAIAARTASSVSDSSLSSGARSTGIAGSAQPLEPAGPSESKSPTTRSGRRPSALGGAAPAVGGDDEPIAVGPARPGAGRAPARPVRRRRPRSGRASDRAQRRRGGRSRGRPGPAAEPALEPSPQP